MALTPAELNAAQAQINAAREQTHTNIGLAEGWAQIAQDAAEASGSGSAQVATAEANRAGQQRALAETARTGAEAARDRAEPARDRAEAARDRAEAARDRAEAVPDTVDGLVPELIDNPTSATREHLEAIYGPPAIAPESQFPAGIYNHPPTMQDAAAFAGIAPSVMGLVKSIENRNRIETQLPAMTFMLTGRPSDQPRNLSSTILENVPSPTNPGRSVWKATSAEPGYNAIVRRYVTAQEASPGGPDTVPPTTAVTGWVYLTEPEKVDRISFNVYNSEDGLGSWQRNTSFVDGFQFKKGWNRYRVPARASDPLRLTNMRECAFSVHPKEGETITAYIGPMVLEHRPKASVVVMNDWGSKPFLDNGYPSCKANNIPVTWGVRVNRMGDSTSYPNNHISAEEAKMLMNENDNVMSFHSWNGNANSDYTEEEARQVNLLCQAGLAARGLWSEGAVHRMAWVQNLAPNATGAYDYLVTSGGHTDSYNNICWPPNNPKSIPRWGVHGDPATVEDRIDANFAELQTTHDAALVYTHAVLPQNEPNHAAQESWDYFIDKVVEGVNAGWLEAVTIPQLVARERLEIPHNPDEIPLPFEEPFDVQAALADKEPKAFDGTQAEYDALGTYDPDRAYYITD